MRKKGFSLAEMMVVLLILSIILAASMPLFTKKTKHDKDEAMWRYSTLSLPLNSVIYYGSEAAGPQRVAIGTNSFNGTGDGSGRLIINSDSSGSTAKNQIVLQDGGAKTGILRVDANGNTGLGNVTLASSPDKYSTAIGYGAKASANSCSAFGSGAQAFGQYSLAVGNGSKALELWSVALGTAANAHPVGTAVGAHANAAYHGVALGFQANYNTAPEQCSIAIGPDANANATVKAGSIAIGFGANINSTAGQYSIAIGHSAFASGSNSTTLGFNAQSTGLNSLALGYNTTASGKNSTVLGASAVATHESSTALGHNAQALNNNSTAIGTGAATTASNQIVIGTLNDTVKIPGTLDCNFGTLQVDQLKLKVGAGQYSNVLISGDGTNHLYTELPSDSRLKNIKGESLDGLEKIRQLKTYNYTLKSDKKKTPRVGVIAQDLQKVFPKAVTKDEKGYLMIRTEDMFYAMVNAIKQLDKVVQKIEVKIAALVKENQVTNEKIQQLENENNQLKAQNKQLEDKNRQFEARLKKLESKLR